MDHVVKLSQSSMSSADDWNKLMFELDPTLEGGGVIAVELTVKNVFFELST